MTGDLLDLLLSRIGQPVPCALCGTPVPPGSLTEATVPGYLVREWGTVVQRITWVCPACPVP